MGIGQVIPSSSPMLPSSFAVDPYLSVRAILLHSTLHTPLPTLQGAQLPASERMQACFVSGIPIQSLSQSVQYSLFLCGYFTCTVREVAWH